MDFKTIIKDQRAQLEQIEKTENIIARTAFAQGKKFLKYPNILAVIGVRRCGKSIFAYLLSKDSPSGYISFDDERLADLKTADLNSILQAFYELYGDIEYVVLDEIQNVDKWELFAARLRNTKKVILTGSNSKLLSGELATHLTGRHLDIQLFPFSFKEFLSTQAISIAQVISTREKAEILKKITEYLENGGFPETQKFGKDILPKIYEDILFKDILFRHKIKKKTELQKLAYYLITNAGKEITYNKLSNIVNIRHISTVSKWISYLEEAFLIFKLERFAFKLKQQFLAPKKTYCMDTGILTSKGFRFSENHGQLMENCVAIELQRKKTENYGMEIYYWKDHQQREVDFVVKQGLKISELIQVSYITDQNEIQERETDNLLKASQELKCRKLKLITWDYENVLKIKNKIIQCTPLWKWLLQK